MIRRVAYLSMHTSPLLQPGIGDAGGMNVYLHELSKTMAARGIEVVVYTRRTDEDQPYEIEVEAGYSVVHVAAGPPTPLPVAKLPTVIGELADSVIEHAYKVDSFDLLHSHYWLSGWAGVLIKETLDLPLANSFHTLGRVKDLTRAPGTAASSRLRVVTEEEVIARSDCVIASTPYEFEDLLDHYGASPEALCTSPPGIDHKLFVQGDKREARTWLGLGHQPLVLFVGRIQALKGIDVLVEALAKMPHDLVADRGPPELVVVGGPSGPDGASEMAQLQDLASTHDLTERIHFVAPQPHDQLARFYQAADVLAMPSRSESFGLVAAEAQACGLPVVASRIGGIPYVVSDGASGFLVKPGDTTDLAAALSRVLGDPHLASALGRGGIEYSAQFSWQATADRLLELYAGISGQ